MDAVEYLKTLKRICEEKEWGSSCMDCPGVRICGVRIYNATQEEMDKAINAAEEWAKEHQPKNRNREFLNMFPHALTLFGVVDILPCNIDTRKYKDDECNKFLSCEECRRKYWTEEIE